MAVVPAVPQPDLRPIHDLRALHNFDDLPKTQFGALMMFVPPISAHLFFTHTRFGVPFIGFDVAQSRLQSYQAIPASFDANLFRTIETIAVLITRAHQIVVRAKAEFRFVYSPTLDECELFFRYRNVLRDLPCRPMLST